MPDYFNAHIELRRLLLGKVMPPFTPLPCFAEIGVMSRFNEDLSPACLIGPIDSAGATAVLNPPAVASQDLENANG